MKARISIWMAALIICGLLEILGPHVAAQGQTASDPIGRWRFGGPTASQFQGSASGAQPIGSDPRTPPTIPVGGNPVAVAVDDATHTAYVTNGNDATVSVVDTTHCRAGDTSGCQQHWPTATVGNGPVNLAVNHLTHTVYVANIADNTVSVIDGTTCNAADHAGCRTIPPTIPVGLGPDYVGIDEATNTIYVADDNLTAPGAVSVIDGNRCDAAVTAGCSQTPPAVTVGVDPIGLAVDPTNHTVYVANCGLGPIAGCAAAGSLSMLDMSTCNATITAGCAQAPPTVMAPRGAAWVDVDQSTDTVYVSGFGPSLGAVSLIDGSVCNATVSSGCGTPQLVVVAGSTPIGLVVDQETHGVFVSNQEDSTVSVIDGTLCNVHAALGCSLPPLSVGVGFNAATPGLDPATQTLYVPSQDLNAVSVVGASSCTLIHLWGCRPASPTTTVGNAPQGILADPATGAVYVANRSDNTLSLVDGHTCNAWRPLGCARAWPTIPVGMTPQFIALDQATRTAYIANLDGTVSAFDAAHCNATIQSGCQMHTITVSPTPHGLDWMAVDDANHTLYVSDIDAGGIALIDMSHCNAADFSGCGQTPQLASTGAGSKPDGVVLDTTSRTLYVAEQGANAVAVLDAASCNAQVTTGCSGPHPSVTVDSRPTRIALDQATETVFAASRDTDRVAVIDVHTCNAATTAGCGAPVATISVAQPTGGDVYHPITIAVDERANRIYLTDVVDSDIVVLSGATCNGRITRGCTRRIGALIRTGGWPSGITLDPLLGTGYNSDNVDGAVSVFGLLR